MKTHTSLARMAPSASMPAAWIGASAADAIGTVRTSMPSASKIVSRRCRHPRRPQSAAMHGRCRKDSCPLDVNDRVAAINLGSNMAHGGQGWQYGTGKPGWRSSSSPRAVRRAGASADAALPHRRAAPDRPPRGLGIKPPTLDRRLSRLEAAGFVERRQAPDDARATPTLPTLLTPRGRGTCAQLREVWRQADVLPREALPPDDAAERERLLDALARGVFVARSTSTAHQLRRDR